MSRKRTAMDHYVNWQNRATEFAPGDTVVFYGHRPESAGRVVQVWPAIGMVDVQFPHCQTRVPVEELTLLGEDGNVVAPQHEDIPGGAGTSPVSGGPNPYRVAAKHAQRKEAIYWANKDRQYKATRREMREGIYTSPKAKGVAMRPTSYKRERGKSERILVCPESLFVIREDDINGCEGVNPKKEPCLPKGFDFKDRFSSDEKMRNKLVRLAYHRPDMREEIMPLLRDFFGEDV